MPRKAVYVLVQLIIVKLFRTFDSILGIHVSLLLFEMEFRSELFSNDHTQTSDVDTCKLGEET